MNNYAISLSILNIGIIYNFSEFDSYVFYVKHIMNGIYKIFIK